MDEEFAWSVRATLNTTHGCRPDLGEDPAGRVRDERQGDAGHIEI
jgi:hypothetical protein